MSDILVNDYDKILMNVIPNLKDYPRKSGGEGVAYFLNEDLVVKEFVSCYDWAAFDEVFESYCLELQDMQSQGFDIPKIYSWVKIPTKANSLNSKYAKHYNYYILEERVPGRELFFGFLEECYELCESLCSRKEYGETLRNPNNNVPLFKEIVKTYMTDYIQMNEFLESMPESKLDKLILDAYNLFMFSSFSVPDIHPSNILVSDEGNVKMIDNIMTYDEEDRMHTFDERESEFISSLMCLFLYNSEIKHPVKNLYYNLEDTTQMRDLKPLIVKNNKVCKAAIKRIIKQMNKVCEGVSYKERRQYEQMIKNLKSLFSPSEVEQIMAPIRVEC